jgi:EAL domain
MPASGPARTRSPEGAPQSRIVATKTEAEGKSRYEFFHPPMQSEIGRRIRLEFDLRTALAADQFCLVYLPIYNLDDLSVVGVEALLRRAHSAEGLLGPEEFIPILGADPRDRRMGPAGSLQADGGLALEKRHAESVSEYFESTT